MQRTRTNSTEASLRAYLIATAGWLLFASAPALAAAQLGYGKYFGALQVDGSKQQLAVVLDTFLTQVGDPIANPTDPNNYPQVNATIRVNLGGYQGAEYATYHFYKPSFNFEQGVLQLDDPDSDLSATLTVTNNDTVTVLEGPVVYRPTQTKGHLRVLMDSDGFDANNTGAAPKVPFVSKLSGEYRGKCGTHSAALQIETGRGVGPSAPGSALTGYTITGRVGYEDEAFCPTGEATGIPAPSYCSLYAFSTGIYYLFDDKLTLQGPQSLMDCTRQGETFACTLRVPGVNETCSFERKAPPSTPPNQYLRQFYLKVAADGMKPMPAPLPPANADLIKALGGQFYGFLHHENRDVYQAIQMNVVATTSTQNQHIQNEVMITPSVSTFLGDKWDTKTAFSTQYPQRVFYVNPGFALQSDGDNFLVVGDWRQGYLRGVWYSRTYGRVGTFEMQKGTKPAVPPKMKLVPGFAGEFEGPTDGPDWVNRMWWASVSIPGQQAAAKQSSVNLLGQYMMRGGLTPLMAFDTAAFDANTGALTFLLKNPKGDRLMTADVVSETQLSMVWAPGPALGAPMGGYGPYTFQRPSPTSTGSN